MVHDMTYSVAAACFALWIIWTFISPRGAGGTVSKLGDRLSSFNSRPNFLHGAQAKMILVLSRLSIQPTEDIPYTHEVESL